MLSLTPGADDRSGAKRLSSVDVWASVCDKLDLPSGPGQEDWVTVTFNLERLDGTPAEPASIKTTILSWQPGDTIPLDAKRTLQVVRVRDDDADQAPVLVVADLA